MKFPKYEVHISH